MAENNEIREESVVVGRTIGVLVLLTGLLLAAHLCAAESPSANPVPSIFKPHSTPAESIYHLSFFVLSITALIFLISCVGSACVFRRKVPWETFGRRARAGPGLREHADRAGLDRHTDSDRGGDVSGNGPCDSEHSGRSKARDGS